MNHDLLIEFNREGVRKSIHPYVILYNIYDILIMDIKNNFIFLLLFLNSIFIIKN
jgi:hypothetical protein